VITSWAHNSRSLGNHQPIAACEFDIRDRSMLESEKANESNHVIECLERTGELSRASSFSQTAHFWFSRAGLRRPPDPTSYKLQITTDLLLKLHTRDLNSRSNGDENGEKTLMDIEGCDRIQPVLNLKSCDLEYLRQLPQLGLVLSRQLLHTRPLWCQMLAMQT
jgi:hypothetical protein